MCVCVLHILCDSAEIRHPFGCLAFCKERERERVYVSVFACTLYVHQRGKGALIIAAPPQPPPSVQSQEVFLSDPCGRACRRKKEAHTHKPQTRKRSRKKFYC